MALDLLVRSAQNRKKCTFLDNLRTITQEGNIEQITLVGDGVAGGGGVIQNKCSCVLICSIGEYH